MRRIVEVLNSQKTCERRINVMARSTGMRFFLVLLALVGTSWTLQAQLNRGTIEGIVTDPQQGVVPNVDVTITNIATGVATSLKTNSTGYFRAVDLVPGTFTARFEASGFATLDLTGIQVTAGTVTRVDTQMKLGQTVQRVEVKAEVPLVDTAPANISSTLETHTIQDIPLQGRDLQQLVFLVPGVNSIAGPPGSNFGFSSQFGTFPDPTDVLGSNLSVNGGQGGANAWYLDGSLNLSSFAENAVISPSPDAVTEFQVITDAFSPEYSRTGGGVFNVVMKSGTNAFHGDIYEYTRQSGLNVRNPFTSVGVDPFTGKSGIIRDRQMH
jgi:carboxypeptidase family protein